MKCPMYDSCTLRTGACVASLPDNGCYWYRWFKDLIQKTENPWHTGTPTEEGWYLLYVRGTIPFRVAYMRNWQWLSTDDSRIRTDVVIEWQKIEENEDGRTD